jgi:quercetin dioxygenase-like cupin family protein
VFVRAIVVAPAAGWLSATTLGSIAVTAALIAGFVYLEKRVERPLVRLAILRSALLVRANLGAALLFGAATAFNVVNTLYLQDVLGWSPLATGLAFMASSLVTAVVGPRAGALASRVGADVLALAGGVATLAASLVLLRIGTSTDVTLILAARLLAGLGFALAYPSLNIQALTGVRDDEQGLASGLVGSSFQIGGAIVLGITTAVLVGATPDHATAAQTVSGFKAGIHVTAAANALLILVSLSGLLVERACRGVLQPAAGRKDHQMQITRSSIETQKGPAAWFTGDVYIDAVAAPAGTSTFAAARCALHAWRADRVAHAPARQTIYVTEGVGLCQREGEPIEVIRPGDHVFFETGENHWHGAAPDRFMVHIAMQQLDDSGSPVSWGEHVTDEQYSRAPTE